MALKHISDWLDVIHHVVEVVAIIVGGLWAYFRFRIKRESKWNLNVKVAAAVFPHSSNRRLLIVNMTLHNVGNVVVYGKKDDKEGECCAYVYKIQKTDKDKYIGPIEVDYNRAKNEVGKVNFLEEEGYYYLEPGATYEESAAFVVKAGRVYAVVGAFTELDGTRTATEKFVRVE